MIEMNLENTKTKEANVDLENERAYLLNEIREISKAFEYMKTWVETTSLHIEKEEFNNHVKSEIFRFDKWKARTEKYMALMEDNYISNLDRIKEYGAKIVDGEVKIYASDFECPAQVVYNKGVRLSHEIGRAVWFVRSAEDSEKEGED